MIWAYAPGRRLICRGHHPHPPCTLHRRRRNQQSLLCRVDTASRVCKPPGPSCLGICMLDCRYQPLVVGANISICSLRDNAVVGPQRCKVDGRGWCNNTHPMASTSTAVAQHEKNATIYAYVEAPHARQWHNTNKTQRYTLTWRHHTDCRFASLSKCLLGSHTCGIRCTTREWGLSG